MDPAKTGPPVSPASSHGENAGEDVAGASAGCPGGGALPIVAGVVAGGALRPIKVYVHLRDAAGQIVAQWDGLGAAWEGWRLGDTLVQVATIVRPESLPPGDYQVVAGLYDPLTNQRWRFADGQNGVELFPFALP